jgi:ADP-ribosylglycohydrolase
LKEIARADTKLFLKSFGCIIGDAIGISVETMHHEDIEAQLGKETGFVERHKTLFT